MLKNKILNYHELYVLGQHHEKTCRKIFNGVKFQSASAPLRKYGSSSLILTRGMCSAVGHIGLGRCVLHFSSHFSVLCYMYMLTSSGSEIKNKQHPFSCQRLSSYLTIPNLARIVNTL